MGPLVFGISSNMGKNIVFGLIITVTLCSVQRVRAYDCYGIECFTDACASVEVNGDKHGICVKKHICENRIKLTELVEVICKNKRLPCGKVECSGYRIFSAWHWLTAFIVMMIVK